MARGLKIANNTKIKRTGESNKAVEILIQEFSISLDLRGFLQFICGSCNSDGLALRE